MLEEITQEQSLTAEPPSNLSAQQALINYISYSQEVKSKKIDVEILKDFSKSAQKAINFSDNWFKETTFSKSSEELMQITKKTLDNFKEYFQEKLLSSDSVEILNNLGSSGQFYQRIPNPPNKEALISTMQEYSGYLVKLVALLENTNSEEDESSKKVLDSLAKFPGESGQVDFICLQGTTQRIREQSISLDKITYVEQAVKNLLLTKTSQLAPSIYSGNQVHIESCLLYMLHTDQLEISKIDGFYSAPIKNIELKEALTFVGNFSQKFDEELDQIIDNLYENYQKMPLTSSFSDNNTREDFVAKINFAIQSSSAVILTQNDIFEIDEEAYEPSLKSDASFKEIILSKIKNSQPDSQDFFRDFLTPEKLFHQDTDIKELDITKIDNLLNLFTSNESENEQQKQANIAIGIKTLNLLAEKFKGSNILFLACFFEKFEGQFEQKFEDFFYQPEAGGTTREIKPEYEKYKNIIRLTLYLYNSNLQKYYGSEVELLNRHKEIYKIGTVSDQEDEDLEKLTSLISQPDFMKLKSGESNILHYPRQFFGKNTIKFILENVSEEIFLDSIQLKLVADTQDPLNNLNPIQIATYNKDQEMLSLFLDLKFNHQNKHPQEAPIGVDDKFKFIKDNKLLLISLKNNDLQTFDFLLKQFDGVDMVTKIKDGIANNDAEILEILDLVTKRGNIEFFLALKLHSMASELNQSYDTEILTKLRENAIKNDNPDILKNDLEVTDITPYISKLEEINLNIINGNTKKINHKSTNIIKSYFDEDFINKNSDFAYEIFKLSITDNYLETADHLFKNGNFSKLPKTQRDLQDYLIKSIKDDGNKKSKFLIEKISEASTQTAGCFGDKSFNLDSLKNIEEIDDDGRLIFTKHSYLSLACKLNRQEIAKFLIEKGAKITDDCFNIVIKTKNKDILNLLIKSEMEKSGKTKLEVLKEKSPLIFKKFYQNFDLKILKNLFEDLDDSEKKEFLNFKINSGLFCIRSESTVFNKISKIRFQPLPISESNEIYSYISNLGNIAHSETPAQTTTTANADLVMQQHFKR